MRERVVWLVVALYFCTAALPARATQIDLGVTAALASGTHQEQSGRSTVPLIPVPLLTLRIPMQRFEIFAEGVPPIGPVPYRGVMQGISQSTLLSYMNASLRYRVAPHLSVGVGETIYNQSTTYSRRIVTHGFMYSCQPFSGCTSTPVTFTNETTQVDSSHVPGMRFEVLGNWPAGKNSWLSAGFAVTPSMHAVVRTSEWSQGWISPAPPLPLPVPGRGPYRLGFNAPETGSQVDGSIAAGRRFGPYSIVYGLRYINYLARFNRDGSLADRNTLLLPFVGFERTLGH
jgi:hypothetical protein